MISPILAKLNEYEFRCDAIHKANLKHIDKDVIDYFCSPEGWKTIYKLILFDLLDFKDDREGKIPKKDSPGEFREVSIGPDESRILFALINEALFDLYGDIMIHPRAKAYQKGIGTGRVVKEASREIKNYCDSHNLRYGDPYALKADYSKYFDTVYRNVIFGVFDRIEDLAGFPRGKEPVMNLCRRVYSNDGFILMDGTRVVKYRGLRQGNALASFLANVVLYDVDEYMSKKYPYYVRYSDDSLIITSKPEDTIRELGRLVSEYGVKLNPKKVEIITIGEWFKFLGFSLRHDGQISLSKARLKRFYHEIKIRTKPGTSYKKARNAVLKYMYKGNGEHSWATSVLPVVNNEHDLDMMNRIVMDRLRGVVTGKHELWGIGYDKYGKKGVIPFEEGTNVAENKRKIPKLEGYDTIKFWKYLLINSREVYNAKIRLIA